MTNENGKQKRNDFQGVLTFRYIKETEDLSMEDQVKALKAKGFTGKNLRWYIQKYRSRYAEQGTDILDESEVDEKCKLPSGTVLDKREARDLTWDDVDGHYEVVQKKKERNAKQTTVNVSVGNKDRYLGVVLIGDMHLGSNSLDKDRLKREIKLMKKNKHQLIAIQVGDVFNNEGSSTHLNGKRVAPDEMSLRDQRQFAVMVFNNLKDVLVAFILGNHDERLLVSSDYDFGEHLTKKVAGAYLGFMGDLFVHFDDGLIYKIHLTHKGKGFSLKNAAHSGMRVADEDHSFDVVVFGHLHDGVAYLDQPMGGGFFGRAMAIRTGGYKGQSHFAEVQNYTPREMDTPMIILHPTRKYISVHRDVVEGVKALNGLNSLLDAEKNGKKV